MGHDEIIKFIELVERKPVLYNKRSGNYKRTDIKAKIWREIAVTMEFNEDAVAVKKWKYLRDKYVKIRREGRTLPTGTGADEAEEITEWPFLSHLEFLEPYIQQRRHYSNIARCSGDTREEGNHEVEEQKEKLDTKEIAKTEEFMNTDNVSSANSTYTSPSTPATSRSTSPGVSTCNTPSTSRAKSPARSTSKRRSTSSSIKSDVTDIDQAIANVSAYFAKKTAEDSDTAFCNYVATEMKKMTKAKKKRTKTDDSSLFSRLRVSIGMS